MSDPVPPEVLRAYGFEDAALTPITIGLVNLTYAVRSAEGRFVLQRLHPVFRAEVNEDVEAITAHLAARGVPTPRLVRTRSDEVCVRHERPWRVLTWLDGRVHGSVAAPAIAHEAGRLAATFQTAVADLEHRFAFTRPSVHDLPAHLARLQAAHAGLAGAHPIDPIACAILALGAALPPLPATRTRIVHGDLKITNLLFDEAGERGVALLDLDTMAHGTLPVELGDALRSWCNPLGESASDAHVDLALAAAALAGFRAAAAADPDELAAIPLGLATIALELASRFALDAIEDRYFGWDAARFASRVEHNLARARSQLALASDALARRADLDALLA